MRDFAIIPAAGGAKDFWKPIPLLSLGTESVIFRLLRQLRESRIFPIVAVGSPGEHGWATAHVEEIRKIPTWKSVVTSPHSKERSPLKTVEFLLRYLVRNNEWLKAEAKSRVFVIFGDWIFSDSLLAETVSYPASVAFSHIFDEWGLVIEFGKINAFLKFSSKFKTLGILTASRKDLRALGFNTEYGSQKNAPDRFCEIDIPRNYELAFEMISREWQDGADHRLRRKRMIRGYTFHCGDLFHVGHLHQLRERSRSPQERSSALSV